MSIVTVPSASLRANSINCPVSWIQEPFQVQEQQMIVLESCFGLWIVHVHDPMVLDLQQANLVSVCWHEIWLEFNKTWRTQWSWGFEFHWNSSPVKSNEASFLFGKTPTNLLHFFLQFVAWHVFWPSRPQRLLCIGQSVEFSSMLTSSPTSNFLSLRYCSQRFFPPQIDQLTNTLRKSVRWEWHLYFFRRVFQVIQKKSQRELNTYGEQEVWTPQIATNR
jgi:hypothetical protein